MKPCKRQGDWEAICAGSDQGQDWQERREAREARKKTECDVRGTAIHEEGNVCDA